MLIGLQASPVYNDPYLPQIVAFAAAGLDYMGSVTSQPESSAEWAEWRDPSGTDETHPTRGIRLWRTMRARGIKFSSPYTPDLPEQDTTLDQAFAEGCGPYDLYLGHETGDGMTQATRRALYLEMKAKWPTVNVRSYLSWWRNSMVRPVQINSNTDRPWIESQPIGNQQECDICHICLPYFRPPDDPYSYLVDEQPGELWTLKEAELHLNRDMPGVQRAYHVNVDTPQLLTNAEYRYALWTFQRTMRANDCEIFMWRMLEQLEPEIKTEPGTGYTPEVWAAIAEISKP